MTARSPSRFALALLVAACARAPEEVEPAPVVAGAEPASEPEEERTAPSRGRELGGDPVGTLGLRGLEASLAETLRSEGQETSLLKAGTAPSDVVDAYRVTAAYADTDPLDDLAADVASHARRAGALRDRISERRRTLGRVRDDSPAAASLRAEIASLEGAVERHAAEAGRLRDALVAARGR